MVHKPRSSRVTTLCNTFCNLCKARVHYPVYVDTLHFCNVFCCSTILEESLSTFLSTTTNSKKFNISQSQSTTTLGQVWAIKNRECCWLMSSPQSGVVADEHRFFLRCPRILSLFKKWLIGRRGM